MDAKRPEYGLISKVTRIYRTPGGSMAEALSESLWFSVEQPSEMWTAHPTFWFELMPGGLDPRHGYYLPKPLDHDEARARIDREPGPWRL